MPSGGFIMSCFKVSVVKAVIVVPPFCIQYSMNHGGLQEIVYKKYKNVNTTETRNSCLVEMHKKCRCALSKQTKLTREGEKSGKRLANYEEK